MNFLMKGGLEVLLLVTSLSMVMSELKLQVLHTNDMHARFQETDAHSGPCVRPPCYGGFARLKTAVDRFREDGSRQGWSTIFLNAGDTYQGTIFFTLFKDKIVSELLNMMSIDVMVSSAQHCISSTVFLAESFLVNVTLIQVNKITTGDCWIGMCLR